MFTKLCRSKSNHALTSDAALISNKVRFPKIEHNSQIVQSAPDPLIFVCREVPQNKSGLCVKKNCKNATKFFRPFEHMLR